MVEGQDEGGKVEGQDEGGKVEEQTLATLSGP